MRDLATGLALVLVFIGGKMLASHYYQVPTETALIAVGSILAISVAASILHPQKKAA